MILTLPGGPEASARARHRVASARPSIGARDDAMLVLTELVTNAVRHGGAADAGRPVAVTMTEADGQLTFEVRDSGRGFTPEPRCEPDLQVGGLGLVIVDRLAREWGVRDEAGATVVWATLGPHAERAQP